MKWKLYWLDGRTEIIEGDTIADAFTKAGYGMGAIGALDYYEPIEEELSCSKKCQEDSGLSPAF